MKKIPVLILIVLIVFSAGVLISCSGKKGGPSTKEIGKINTPAGVVKVTLTSPSGLEDRWTTIGMNGPYSVQLRGTLTNRSNQNISVSQVIFLSDGYQAGYIRGKNLLPGESIEIVWGKVYPSKTLEIIVK